MGAHWCEANDRKSSNENNVFRSLGAIEYHCLSPEWESLRTGCDQMTGGVGRPVFVWVCHMPFGVMHTSGSHDWLVFAHPGDLITRRPIRLYGMRFLGFEYTERPWQVICRVHIPYCCVLLIFQSCECLTCCPVRVVLTIVCARVVSKFPARSARGNMRCYFTCIGRCVCGNGVGDAWWMFLGCDGIEWREEWS